MQVVDRAVDPGRHRVLPKRAALFEHLTRSTRRFRTHFERGDAEESVVVQRRDNERLLTHEWSIASRAVTAADSTSQTARRVKKYVCFRKNYVQRKRPIDLTVINAGDAG